MNLCTIESPVSNHALNSGGIANNIWSRFLNNFVYPQTKWVVQQWRWTLKKNKRELWWAGWFWWKSNFVGDHKWLEFDEKGRIWIILLIWMKKGIGSVEMWSGLRVFGWIVLALYWKIEYWTIYVCSGELVQWTKLWINQNYFSLKWTH